MEMEPPMTFVELMQIEELKSEDGNGEIRNTGERRFMSLQPAYEPGNGTSYGGHVFAQAVWAASGTVEEGLVAHNVHGFFTLPGLPDKPYVYQVSTLSSGRSYATRYVTVKQPLVASSNRPFRTEDSEKGLSGVCFACIVSFKRDEKFGDEEMGTGHQMKEGVRERFTGVFEGLDPGTLQKSPAVDAPWYRQLQPKPDITIFPGLEMHLLSVPSASNDPTQFTNFTCYRTIGVIPPASYNLHACAHIYASDRNSIEIVGNALGWADDVGSIGSLSHSVIFHVPRDGLVIQEGEWWVQEARTVRSGEGRGLHSSWIWRVGGEIGDRRTGEKDMHVASQWQEGMIRRTKEKDWKTQREMWWKGMRGRRILRDEKARSEVGKSKL